jgi:hypothetical protein
MANASSFITIVSGLPRSGTSLMMQMLAAGGLPIFSDGARAPDESNPRGYLEHERVKRLKTETDFSWLAGARGRALKVIHLLLPYVPASYDCRVILMRRRVEEVLASQRAMLVRQGLPGAALPDERLGQILLAQLRQTEQWIDRSAGWPVLPVEYESLITNPAAEVERISAFLDLELDAAAMIATVDPRLWRQRPDAGFLTGCCRST